MRWTVFDLDVHCGGCSRSVRAGDPVQLLTSRQLKRCAACAIGPVDDAEIQLERERLSFDRADDLRRRQANAAARQDAERSFRRLSDLARAFDAKAAAAGDRE